MNRKTVIVVTGPTASGKTSLALALAGHFKTAIISADSRQCYTELNIGVAKPTPAELQEVKHYFINSHSIHDDLNAAAFEQYALAAVKEIFNHNDMAIMVGGTGLYIKAFCEGLDQMPPIPDELRQEIVGQYEREGIEWLQQQVRQHDPLYYATGEMLNPRRLMRALEIKLATGKSIRDLQQKNTASRNFHIIKSGIDLPKSLLYQRINDRTDKMMEEGLLNEAKSLTSFRNRHALHTVGYSELFDHLDGNSTLDEAVNRIKINTRHYAKRQLTWFRKDPEISWISEPRAEHVLQMIKT